MSGFPTRLGPSIHDQNWLRRKVTKPVPAVMPSWASTYQARILNPAVIGTSSTDRGIVIGPDLSSGAAYFHDVFTLYEEKKLSNPNVIVIGPLGSGKSVLVKTLYVMRQLMMQSRRAVVLDLKARGDDGDSEYGEATRYMGGDPFLMWPGHPDCTTLNILDPIILAGGGAGAAASLLNAVAELGGDGPLSALEQGALTTAHQLLLAKFKGGRTPVLPDLLDMFPEVVNADAYSGFRGPTRDRVDEAALLASTRLQRALADDVAGLFDGETSKTVGLQQKLTTFNICNLPKQGPAMGMVMAVVHAWLMGTLRNNPDRWKTTLVMEEAWAFDAVAREIRSYEKLARGLGLSNIGILQHLSDPKPGSDGESLVREAGTAHLFRAEQEKDAEEYIGTFGLNPDNAGLLRTLPQGEHLIKVGARREVHVQGHLTDTEYRITETDGALKA